MPPFRAAQIVGARFAFFVSLAHVKDRLKQGDGVFESGLGNRRFWGLRPGASTYLLGKRLVIGRWFKSGLCNETLLLVIQAGCSSEPIPRTPSNFASASNSRPLSGRLVSGNKAVNRPRAGRNAQTL